MSSYVEQLFSLDGKVAIVTGSSKGIGSEIAMALLKAGAKVMCVSRSASPNKKELSDFYMQCDVSHPSKFRNVCEQTNNLYGKIDILVNAAGVSFETDSSVDKFEIFNKTLSINLIAVYQCCEIASVYMPKGSSIINISSIGSILGFPSNPGYVASKGGVRMLTKSLAEDLSHNNIRVNNIAPGYILTDMTKKSFNNESKRNKRINRMMIKRWGNVEDISGAAVFLASNASSYITGIDLIIDGGWTAKGI